MTALHTQIAGCILAVMHQVCGNIADVPPAPDYSSSGVDLSLIRWMLAVEFVVVEGVAAVVQGAPVQTFDLDSSITSNP